MPVGIVAAGVGAAGAIGGAIISSNAASNSADAVARASRDANKTQLQIYNDNKATFKPYVDAGVSALDPLLASYGLKGQAAQQAAIDSFHSAPDYQFSLDQGLKGVQGSAAARGGVYSGGALKALDRYGSDYAQTYLQNWRGGLQGLVNTGQGGAVNTAGAGQNYANAFGANTMAAGNARASAYGAQGQAWSGALGDLATTAAYGAGNGWFNSAATPLAGGAPSSYGVGNYGKSPGN